MSRIGNRELKIPAGVTVTVEENLVKVSGSKGTLEFVKNSDIKVTVEGDIVKVERLNEQKKTREMHGTTNALIANMIKGVSDGYQKGLEIIGVGYNFNLKGNTLVVKAGYSHVVEVSIPEGITVEAVSNTEITVKGIDKKKVGDFAAKIREIRKPEPYKGKGIRYKDEYIRRKEGKKASK